MSSCHLMPPRWWGDRRRGGERRFASSSLEKDSRNFDYFLDCLATLLRHFKRFDAIMKRVTMFSTLLRSFWWLNERSTSSIKRDIGRQSLRKFMNLRSNLRNLPNVRN